MLTKFKAIRAQLWPGLRDRTEQALKEADEESGGTAIHYPLVVWLNFTAEDVFVQRGYGAFKDELTKTARRLYETFYGELTQEQTEELDNAKKQPTKYG